jgi:heptose-I-phosphate ethanolaminephosphotransferase
MKIKGILKNKYTLPLLFMLALLVTDVLLHKGMTRVMLPGNTFPKTTKTFFTRCERPLLMTGKNWRQGINTVEKIEQLEKAVAGFEMDVYFDTAKNCLEVYHDSLVYSSLKITSILEVYRSKGLTASVWLDFKNLSPSNAVSALHYISGLRESYGLNNKLIIESSAIELLKGFCDSGFFTSYYVPFFNPYQMQESELKVQLDNMETALIKYPTSAISGYYFQYPVLKNNFPSYPILTWSAKPGASLVANLFTQRLENDKAVKIVLNP